MSQEDDEKYPASAISSWSGFVYQGKIALYHSLKLIHNGDLDFELQLDSSDDFAIYKNEKLHTAHQVKAKISKYLSGYTKALEQSTLIEHDKIKGTTRYFHVSVPLDETGDYRGTNGETVKFYRYGDNYYCGLGEIEGLTKELIKKLCEKQSITVSDNLINFNYCLLSEKISSKAIHNHKLNQVDGISEDKAAYEGRIMARSILEELLAENPYQNRDYYAVELKARLQTHLEERLDQELPTMSDATYERARLLSEHIRKTHFNELKTLCQMMKPSERFQDVQKNDIRRYTKLIQAISMEPIFNHLPHYLDSENRFYVPTALDVDESEECEFDMIHEMKNNGDLLRLLFEYNHLIASKAEASFTFNTKFTNSDKMCPLCGADWEDHKSMVDAIEAKTKQISDSLGQDGKNLVILIAAMDAELKLINTHIQDRLKLLTPTFEPNLHVALSRIKLRLPAIIQLLEKLQSENIQFTYAFTEIDDVVDERFEKLKEILRNKKQVEADALALPEDWRETINRAFKDLQDFYIVTVEDLKDKEKFISIKASEAQNSRLQTCITELKVIEKETKAAQKAQDKIEKLRSILKKTEQSYTDQTISAIEFIFHIYSGRLIQNYQRGLGLFIESREGTQLRFLTAEKSEHDAVMSMSSGQVSALSLAFFLSLNKVYSQVPLILIDDPSQSLDEVNVASLTDLLRCELKHCQLVVSSHEDDISAYMRYRFDRAGLATSSLNMQLLAKEAS